VADAFDLSSEMSASAQWVSHRYRVGSARVQSGQGKVSRRSWAAIPVRGELFVGGVPSVEARQQPGTGPLGVVFVAAAQQPADAGQRVILAAAVSGGLLLDAAADLLDGGTPEAHHVEGIQHPHRVRQRGPQRRGVAPIGSSAAVVIRPASPDPARRVS